MARLSTGRAASQSRHFWQNHFEQWQRSHLSKADYCREQDLYAGTFYNWCHTFSNQKDNARKEKSSLTLKRTVSEPLQLIPVTTVQPPQPNHAVVRVRCGPLSLSLPSDLNPEQINCWLGTLAGLDV